MCNLTCRQDARDEREAERQGSKDMRLLWGDDRITRYGVGGYFGIPRILGTAGNPWRTSRNRLASEEVR